MYKRPFVLHLLAEDNSGKERQTEEGDKRIREGVRECKFASLSLLYVLHPLQSVDAELIRWWSVT